MRTEGTIRSVPRQGKETQLPMPSYPHRPGWQTAPASCPGSLTPTASSVVQVCPCGRDRCLVYLHIIGGPPSLSRVDAKPETSPRGSTCLNHGARWRPVGHLPVPARGAPGRAAPGPPLPPQPYGLCAAPSPTRVAMPEPRWELMPGSKRPAPNLTEQHPTTIVQSPRPSRGR